MTVIRPNSISGITSITGSGGDISIFRADGTAADVTVNNITSGIITGTHYGSGANLTSIPAAQLTGTVADARLSTVSSSKLSGALPALDGSALTGVGASFGNSSVNTSGIITATAFVPTSQGALSHRNLIINGAMTIAQRGTSSTSSGYYTVDRFQLGHTGTDEAPTQAQVDVASGTTPYSLGFRKAFRVTNGNQTSGAGAADAIQYTYKFEAQDIANSGWNYTSSSSYVTLSFWCKSSVAQEFHGFLLTNDGSAQLYSFSTGSLSADTWTKVTKTIPGNSNLTFNNDNGVGINMRISQYQGTNYTGSITENQWAAFNTSIRNPDMTSTWYTTNDATFELTGMQLEVGAVVTPFEHRSIGEELIRCQRYYEKSYQLGDAPGTNTNVGSVMFLTNRSPGTAHTMLRYQTRKRAAPTLISYSSTESDTTGMRNLDDNVTYNYTMNRNGETGCTAYPTGSLNLGKFIQFHYTADAEL